jgi:hypothetical protein
MAPFYALSPSHQMKARADVQRHAAVVGLLDEVAAFNRPNSVIRFRRRYVANVSSR